MISQTAEYALRAILFMAEHAGAPHITQEIAAETHVPPGYLSKVLQSLCKAGLLTSQRGLGGGFTLARNPTELSIYAIVQAVDPIQRITTCPIGKVHAGSVLCPLHRRLDEAIAMVEKIFKETSVAEILNESCRQGAMCSSETVEQTGNRATNEPTREAPAKIAHQHRSGAKGDSKRRSSHD
jgi:Rrf2 family transcriptional regulator, nitric oxide-sensitive transcriptional repressor